SKETVARHAPPVTAERTPVNLPPWFTLAWEDGTFQWIDPEAPHHAWTLYQTNGDFHIRGPQRDVSISGSLEQAQACPMQWARLGRRWTARARITGGRSQGVLALVQKLTHRSYLPKEWSVLGGFELEARASGRRWPARGDSWIPYLDRATLTLQ